MPARAKLINLLPPSEFEKSFWGRFLKWASTAVRRVVIMVELIVILAFLSRFKLDEDIRRMNEEISGKRNLLESSMPFETKFKNIKGQIVVAKGVEKRQLSAHKVIGEVAQLVPLEVRLENMLVTQKSVNITGLAANETALGEMLVRMDKNPSWKSINLSSLNSQANKGVSFVVNIYY